MALAVYPPPSAELLWLIGAVETPGASYAYSYDAAGNRTAVQVDGSTPTTASYDADDGRCRSIA